MLLEIVLGVSSLVALCALLLVRKMGAMSSYWIEKGVKTPAYPPMFPWGNSAILFKCVKG